MSRLNELIQKLCPDGVEFKKLGEVCNFINGFAFKSSLFKEKGEIIIRITNINGTSIELDDVKYFDLNDYNTDLQSFIANYGDILIAMSGATTGKVGYYDNKNKAYLNQRVGKFVPNKKKLNNRYLFHFLCSITTELYIMAGGGAQPNLSSTKLMNNVVIPIPPLDVQNEIVRILDTFTSHAAELQAELQARKEQYEYYRNKLLTFDKDDKNVKWMKLGETYDMKAGKSIPASEISSKRTSENQFPCYGGNGLRGYVSIFNQKGEKVLIGRQGALCGNVCFAENHFYATEHAIVVSDRGYCLPRYTFYLLIIMDLNQYKTAGAQPGLSVSRLEKVLLPIPSIPEQQRIVSILDKFEALVNDLTEGLPAEIAAVQERYEYYRNKLLTFKQRA